MARIVAVADVYDALSSKRCYKRAWSHDEVLNMLNEQSGQHFDPRCVQAFIGQLEEVHTIQARFTDDPGSA